MHLAAACLFIAAAQGLLTVSARAGDEPRCERPLQLGFIDVDAGNFVRGNGSQFLTPPGDMVESAQRVFAALGCQVTMVRLPARRLFADLARGQIDMVVGAPATPDRLKKVHYPLDEQGQPDRRFAVVEARAALLTLERRLVEVSEKLRAGPPGQLSVAVVRGTALEVLAANAGFKVDVTGTVPRALSMLRTGRVDALALASAMVTQPMLATEPTVVELAHPLAEQFYFVPASPRLYIENPALVREIWQQFCRDGRIQFPKRPACPER